MQGRRPNLTWFPHFTSRETSPDICGLSCPRAPHAPVSPYCLIWYIPACRRVLLTSRIHVANHPRPQCTAAPSEDKQTARSFALTLRNKKQPGREATSWFGPPAPPHNHFTVWVQIIDRGVAQFPGRPHRFCLSLLIWIRSRVFSEVQLNRTDSCTVNVCVCVCVIVVRRLLHRVCSQRCSAVETTDTKKSAFCWISRPWAKEEQQRHFCSPPVISNLSNEKLLIL